MFFCSSIQLNLNEDCPVILYAGLGRVRTHALLHITVSHFAFAREITRDLL